MGRERADEGLRAAWRAIGLSHRDGTVLRIAVSGPVVGGVDSF
jgi:hypothetical protein